MNSERVAAEKCKTSHNKSSLKKYLLWNIKAAEMCNSAENFIEYKCKWK